MRRTLAVTALAAAALGLSAPAASAGCYGAQNVVVACWGSGSYNPDPQVTQRPVACVYTGGDTCETVYAPWVTVNTPSGQLSICSPHVDWIFCR